MHDGRVSSNIVEETNQITRRRVKSVRMYFAAKRSCRSKCPAAKKPQRGISRPMVTTCPIEDSRPV